MIGGGSNEIGLIAHGWNICDESDRRVCRPLEGVQGIVVEKSRLDVANVTPSIEPA